MNSQDKLESLNYTAIALNSGVLVVVAIIALVVILLLVMGSHASGKLVRSCRLVVGATVASLVAGLYGIFPHAVSGELVQKQVTVTELSQTSFTDSSGILCSFSPGARPALKDTVDVVYDTDTQNCWVGKLGNDWESQAAMLNRIRPEVLNETATFKKLLTAQ